MRIFNDQYYIWLLLLGALLSACTKNDQASVAKQQQLTEDAPPTKAPPSILIWQRLVMMKPGLKNIPMEVTQILERDVAVVGFIIPNDIGPQGEIREFLLTPVSGGCMHVPPPPPNYVVHVTMRPEVKVSPTSRSVEVTGRLFLSKAKDKDLFSFEMLAESVSNFDTSPYMKY